MAQAAADIVLLASDIEVAADGVLEGRRSFANILKHVRMGASSNFGNMLSMAMASIALPFLPLLPTQRVHVLPRWVSLGSCEASTGL